MRAWCDDCGHDHHVGGCIHRGWMYEYDCDCSTDFSALVGDDEDDDDEDDDQEAL